MTTGSLMSTTLGRLMAGSSQTGGQDDNTTESTNFTRNSTEEAEGIGTVTTPWDMEYETTAEPDVKSTTELVLQIAVPMSPLVIGGLCFLYRYIYITSNLRLGQPRRRRSNESGGSSDPPSEVAAAGAGSGAGAGAGGGISSGLAATLPGIAGVSFAAGLFSGGGAGESNMATTSTGTTQSAQKAEFGCAANGRTNFQSIYAKYCTAASFSNFENT